MKALRSSSALFLLAVAKVFLGTVDACTSNPLHPDSGATATGYSDWLSSLSTGKYATNVYIPKASNECEGMAFHWNIDKATSKISIAVAAKADGWAAIGFSEAGGMKGADIVYYEAAQDLLVDAHVGDAYAMPSKDVFQDWTLISGQKTSDGYVIFEAERALFTNHGHEDHEIMDDSSIHVYDHKMIGAWGDSSSLSFHGDNVVKTYVQLFSSDELDAGNGLAIFQEEMKARAGDNFVILTLEDYEIPDVVTTYYDACFPLNELLQKGLYENDSTPVNIIGMEFLIDPDTVEYAHHMVFQGHRGDQAPDECTDFYLVQIAAWTPGEEFLLFPEGMGLPVGGSDFYDLKSLSINYHFDNPNGDKGVVDNGTGIKVYYTREEVENEIGMLTVGDGTVALTGLSIGEGKTKHTFTCPSSCSENMFYSVDEVTVVRESHHMHEKGKRMVNQHYRGDALMNTASFDYWDFYQSGAGTVRQAPYKFKKGDSFVASCYYDDGDSNSRFGLASDDEMCMTFIYYYPRQIGFEFCGIGFSLPFDCRGAYNMQTLSQDSNFDRVMTDTSTNSDDEGSEPTSGSSRFQMEVSSLFSMLIVMVITFLA